MNFLLFALFYGRLWSYLTICIFIIRELTYFYNFLGRFENEALQRNGILQKQQ